MRVLSEAVAFSAFGRCEIFIYGANSAELVFCFAELFFGVVLLHDLQNNTLNHAREAFFIFLVKSLAK